MKKEKIQITNIRNESKVITTNFMEIRRIVRECYRQLYDNKLDNLDEANKFLETYKLPKPKK